MARKQETNILHHRKFGCKVNIKQQTMFLKFIDLLHGGCLELTTMKELAAFLDIADYLRERTLLDLIQDCIQKDIQKYEIFCLLQLAYRFGLPRIFTICIQYLELDQFQQIKYNKFDFLSCDFQLFQIVLRRHHMMKIHGKILGLDSQDILDVINTYCHRQHIPANISASLIENYVKSIDYLKPQKNSLLLDKLIDGKPMIQSANFQTDCGVAENTLRNFSEGCSFYVDGVRNNKTNISKKFPHVEHRSYRENEMNCNDISIHFEEQNSAQVVEQRKQRLGKNSNVTNVLDEGQKFLTESSCLKVDNLKSSSFEGNDEIPSFEKVCNSVIEQQPQLVASRISTLLTEYESAIKKHSDHFNRMKKSAKSTTTPKNINAHQLSHADKFKNALKQTSVI